MEPAAELDPEAAAELFEASGKVFVSVRSEAGEDEASGAWEPSLAEDFPAAEFKDSPDEARPDLGDALRDDSRPEAEDEEFGLALGDASESAAALVEAEEDDPTPRLRILGSAMMEATTTKATASGTT